jgi:hypothetical protein
LPMARARHLRIGIRHGRHHACNPGLQDGIDARRRLAMVRAWFERDIERAPRRGAGRRSASSRRAAGRRPGPAAPDDQRSCPSSRTTTAPRPDWARRARARAGRAPSPSP